MNKLTTVLLCIIVFMVSAGGTVFYYETNPKIETVDKAEEYYPAGYCDREFTEEVFHEYIATIIEIQNDIMNDPDDLDDWEDFWYDIDEVVTWNDDESGFIITDATGETEEMLFNDLWVRYCRGGE